MSQSQTFLVTTQRAGNFVVVVPEDEPARRLYAEINKAAQGAVSGYPSPTPETRAIHVNYGRPGDTGRQFLVNSNIRIGDLRLPNPANAFAEIEFINGDIEINNGGPQADWDDEKASKKGKTAKERGRKEKQKGVEKKGVAGGLAREQNPAMTQLPVPKKRKPNPTPSANDGGHKLQLEENKAAKAGDALGRSVAAQDPEAMVQVASLKGGLGERGVETASDVGRTDVPSKSKAVKRPASDPVGKEGKSVARQSEMPSKSKAIKHSGTSDPVGKRDKPAESTAQPISTPDIDGPGGPKPAVAQVVQQNRKKGHHKKDTPAGSGDAKLQERPEVSIPAVAPVVQKDKKKRHRKKQSTTVSEGAKLQDGPAGMEPAAPVVPQDSKKGGHIYTLENGMPQDSASDRGIVGKSAEDQKTKSVEANGLGLELTGPPGRDGLGGSGASVKGADAQGQKMPSGSKRKATEPTAAPVARSKTKSSEPFVASNKAQGQNGEVGSLGPPVTSHKAHVQNGAVVSSTSTSTSSKASGSESSSSSGEETTSSEDESSDHEGSQQGGLSTEVTTKIMSQPNVLSMLLKTQAGRSEPQQTNGGGRQVHHKAHGPKRRQKDTDGERAQDRATKPQLQQHNGANERIQDKVKAVGKETMETAHSEPSEDESSSSEESSEASSTSGSTDSCDSSGSPNSTGNSAGNVHGTGLMAPTLKECGKRPAVNTSTPGLDNVHEEELPIQSRPYLEAKNATFALVLEWFLLNNKTKGRKVKRIDWTQPRPDWWPSAYEFCPASLKLRKCIDAVYLVLTEKNKHG